MNTLLNIDCMDYMKTYSDNHFDLAIVDPEYGIGAGKGTSIVFKNSTWKHAEKTHKYESKDWDTKIPDKSYFKELFRISKNCIIFGGNYFTEFLPPNNGWIIWDKKTTNKIFSPFEMIWTTYNKPKIFRFLMEGYKKEKQEDYRLGRIHPTQKPITLYKWLLQNYAKPGDKLFDSHSGSGSFRIAAHDLGFDLVSCELDPDYYRDNEARYQNHIQQIDLFKPAEIQKNIYAQPELI